MTSAGASCELVAPAAYAQDVPENRGQYAGAQLARLGMRTPVSLLEIEISGGSAARGTVSPMFTTLLTKRRAVDHCRTRSALCRMS